MRTNPETASFNAPHGSLLRLAGGREIAIFLRHGTVSVAVFVDGAASLSTAGEWFPVNGRRLAHAQRRGEVDIISPIPAEVASRIERLYRPVAGPANRPVLRWLTRLAAALGAPFANAFTRAT